ncbi:MAG: dihydroorotate dehydrogenase [Candidatus Kerfeldbacteria bacterium]|nr:dihydroorotate dehydrogenase [Candidatus Kerfeldbacteria bacterium]
MIDLSTEFAGLKLANPTVLASGILGVTRDSLKYVVHQGAGACVIKSISKEERKGHDAPNMHGIEGGFMNAVGYSNAGWKASKEEFSGLKEVGAPVIASIIGKDAQEFAFMAEHFLSDEFAAVEAVLSCPHTPGYGTLAGQGTPESTAEITREIRKRTKLPLFIKVSPDSQPIGEIVKAAEAEGADGITAVNTMGPGIQLNIEARAPVLHFGRGGVSGPALRPIAARCISDIYQSVKIPIMGVGGVTTGHDAIEFMMLGASAVQIGTAIYYRGLDVFRHITDEMSEWMEREGFSSVKELIGIAHV